jgi:site-specific recombinase XerD
MREVNADDFRCFLADLRDRPVWRGLNNEQAHRLSGTSINTYARAIKAFFIWLHAEAIIPSNPLATVPAPRKPKTLPKVYSEKDLRAICVTAAASIRDNAVFCLFLDSGIRLSELGTLKIGDVDTQSGTLKVRGKGNKERFAYFSTDVAKYVDCYIKQFRQGAGRGDILFLTKVGQPLRARGIQSLLLRLGKKAGVEERLTPHKLRHSFATLSLKYGGNLEYIKKILGHTDIKTTSEAYLNVQDADVSAAHRHFSPLSNLRDTDAGKVSVLPDAGRYEDQPDVPRTQPEQKPYTETPHRQQMRQLAKELINELSLPWIKDSFAVEFQPDQLELGKERFPFGKVTKGQIQPGLSIWGGEVTGFLHQALRNHLETAGLASELSDMLSWYEGVTDNLKKCHELLKVIRKEVEDTYHTSIPIKDYGYPGFTMDFSILVGADAVQQASGSAHYHDFPYGYVGSNLKFGGFIIYIGTSGEDLKPFEEFHKNLRAKCARWKQTKTIAKQRRDLNNMAIAISQQLEKFSALEHLPGHCELCV